MCSISFLGFVLTHIRLSPMNCQKSFKNWKSLSLKTIHLFCSSYLLAVVSESLMKTNFRKWIVRCFMHKSEPIVLFSLKMNSISKPDFKSVQLRVIFCKNHPRFTILVIEESRVWIPAEILALNTICFEF